MIVAARPIALVGLLALFGCQKEEAAAPPVRPVRSVVVAHAADSDPVTLTGQVQSQDPENLAFRVGGRLLERNADIGGRITEGEIVARLDTSDAESSLRSARANLTAAQAALTQAQSDETRQKELLAKGIVASARYEEAQKTLQSAEAQVDAAEAQVQSAENNLGYTTLRADASGTVTATGAEPGEVVSAGQTILQVARGEGRDAVFNVPARMIRNAPDNPQVTVALADDPGVTATGHVREVSPRADAATGTYAVKVGLTDPPAAMRLGATVVGSISLSGDPVIRLPGTALGQAGGKPVVWVVDPAARTVSPREVGVLRYESDTVIVNAGLDDGEVVVTAGIHALRPGQEVRLLDDAS